MNQTLKNLRLLGFTEAISLLILVFIAMPLKYLAGEPLAVKITGNIHGVLFTVYVIALAMTARQTRWSRRQLLLAFLIASIPFGPFLFDKMLFGDPSQRSLAQPKKQNPLEL